MRILSIELSHFRNHTTVELDLARHLNVITGPNGVGKTSLIDAIHYLCMSRSFVANSDQYVLNRDASSFQIRGAFEGQIRANFTISCTYSRGEGKKIYVNDSPLERLSDLIGVVPVVVLSPDDKKLTSEGPNERRSFLDALISQISKSYLRDLIEYRKVLKQRNRLLSDYDSRYLPDELLEPWNIQLVETGSHIIAMRAKILNDYRAFLQDAYHKMSGIDLVPDFEYKTFCDASDREHIRGQFTQALAEQAEKERELRYTVVGPHRDDLIFTLDGMELRKFGSQGQHRLFAVSLKLAQLFFFSEYLDDLPILLLDDVFGDLDPHKTEVLLDTLAKHEGQTFITAANPVPFDEHIRFSDDPAIPSEKSPEAQRWNRRYHLTSGHVVSSIPDKA
ncbi:MAG TPA: DNA replication and repair protein RecF [Balneolales bacterium]|nr:DNA replication and repair protein RecF [Balneolales bacterium]